MKDFDLVIQENDAFDHFNTGASHSSRETVTVELSGG